MPTRVVKDWLSEYKALPESDVHGYANTIRNNEDLVDALYELFEDGNGPEELEPVCHQLFDFYRSSNRELQRFTIEAIPVMIASYLLAHSQQDKKRCSSIEACLLGVYNLEVIGSDGKPKTRAYTIPTLAVPSVYHEPPSLATLALTESSFRYHSDQHVRITTGPLPQVERLNAQNRLTSLTRILAAYNADIANLSPRSHYSLCKLTSRLVRAGFETSSVGAGVDLNDSLSSQSSRGSKRGVQFRSEPRVPTSSVFLVELLDGVYFAMFNGQASEGIQAVEDIHKRAEYELYEDVLLVTNAIKNSLQFNPSGQPKDGPMGISIALSPTQGSPAFLKSAITNASFRTKKLPEDIDVPDDEKSNAAAQQHGAPPGGENPPNYDDLTPPPQLNDDKHKSSGGKFPKPLKSIMKKGSSASDKPEKTKQVKKDEKRDKKLGVTPDVEAHSPKNPKHSVSMSTGLGAGLSGTAGTSDVTDPTMVGVQVMRSSSSATGRTFQMVDYVELRHQTSTGGASNAVKRASSISEDSAGSNPSRHSRDVSNTSFPEGDAALDGSLDTKM